MLNHRQIGRRAFLATAVALALSACLDETDGKDSVPDASPLGTPQTVGNTAAWSTKIARGVPVVVTDLGILTTTAGKDAGKVSPTLLDSETGAVRWAASEVDWADGDTLHWVVRNGRSWAVLVGTSGTTTSLTVWDGLSGTKKGLEPTSSGSYEGDAAPQVVVSGSGILVSGARDTPPFIFVPDGGQMTRYGQGPQRNGVAGVPVAAGASSTFLVAFPGNAGFSLASATGGWSSNTAGVPEGANPESGTILGVGRGYVVSQWASSAPTPGAPVEGEIIALHALSSGSLKGEYAMAADEYPQTERTGASAQGLAVVTDADNSHVAWGSFVFDLTSRRGSHFALNGAKPTALVENLLYADGARAPLPQEARPSDGGEVSDAGSSAATTSPSSSASDNGGADFSGHVAVDVNTHLPLPGKIETSSYGLSSVRQMVLTNAKQDTVFSVPLK